MKWFLIAYTASGLSVAVSPPQKYSFVAHDEAWCTFLQDDRTRYYAEYAPEKKYTFKCEQHNKRPKLTGKVDRDEQAILNIHCRGYGKACEMLEWDVKRGLPLGTTSSRYWKGK